MRIRFTILFFQIFLSTQAQVLFFERKELSLPSQETYNVVQDGEGYIWIATDQGFCRYDGRKLKVFDGKNGLPELSVYTTKVDKEGRVWGVTSHHRIVYTDNGDVKEAEISKVFQQQKELSSNNHVHRIKLLEEENKIIANSLYDVYELYLDRNEVQKVTKIVADPENTILLRRYGSELVQMVFSSYGGIDRLNILIEDTIVKNHFEFKNIAISAAHYSKIPFTLHLNNRDYIAFSNFIFCLNERYELEKRELPSRILFSYADKDGGLWVGTLGKGVFYFKDGRINSKPIHSLRELSVSGVLEDREGNIWVTTLEKGVYFCKNKHIITYQYLPEMNKMATMLSKMNGKAYFSSAPESIIEIHEDQVRTINIPLSISEAYTDIEEFKGIVYVGNKKQTFVCDTSFSNIRVLRWLHSKKEVFSANLEYDEETVYGVNNSIVFKVNQFQVEEVMALPFYIRDIEHIGYNQWLLAGTNLYLCDFNNGICDRVGDLGFPISDICYVQNNLAVVSTRGGGLFRYYNGEVASYKTILGLPTDVIHDVTEGADDDIWLGTNHGVVKISRKEGKVTVYDTDDGLISNQVLKILIVGDRLYMSTPSGLCSMDLMAELHPSVPPVMRLTSLFVNEEEVEGGITKAIKYENNSVVFNFDVLYYKSTAVRLLYQLTYQNQTSFRDVEGTQIHLHNLNPGDYQLTVVAENSKGDRSDVFSTSFTILKPTWLQWHYLILEFIAFLAFIYGLVLLYIKRVRRKAQEKSRINEMIANSRLAALQSQMNPHFVFNSINSIQKFVLKNDVEQAYNYLTKFSRLIRLVLQYSRRKLISLQEELDMLRLYISLEQLRFNNEFEYKEEIQDGLNLDQLFIPPMLIQPFLENAIWHGITPAENQRKGSISFSLYIEGNLLKVQIEDNGVGRQRNKVKEGYESLALKVTEERLNLLNTVYKQNTGSLRFVDLFDAQLAPIGTKVIFTFPILKEE